MFSVPQYIDIEDKIAGPLTWRQLLWMIGMGATLLVLYNSLDGAMFYAAGIPIALLFIAFAFYRPNGQPLIVFVIYAIAFVFRPKIAVWDRPTNEVFSKPKQDNVSRKPEYGKEKRISQERFKELAKLVDENSDKV